MKAIPAGAVLTAVIVVSLAGCSSPSVQEATNGACSDVKEVVDKQPKLGGDDGGTKFIPAMDKELDAARDAQDDFADAGSAADFVVAWKKMVGAMEENRKAWKTVTPWRGARGTELVGALGLAAASSKVDTAKKSLNAAAKKRGYTTCAGIKWQY